MSVFVEFSLQQNKGSGVLYISFFSIVGDKTP